LAEVLPDPRLPAPDEVLCEREEQQERSQQVAELLAHLTERERTVLTLAFGLGEAGVQQRCGYAEIGRRLGLSRERVRQLYEGALTTLRHRAAQQNGVRPMECVTNKQSSEV